MVTGGDGPGTSSCGRDGVMSFLVLPPEVNSALMFAGFLILYGLGVME